MCSTVRKSNPFTPVPSSAGCCECWLSSARPRHVLTQLSTAILQLPRHAPFRRPSQYLLNFELSKRASVFNLWYHRGAEGAASELGVDWAAVRSLGLPDPWPRASVWQFCVSCTCVRMAINAAFKDFAVWAAGTSIGERAKQCHIQVHLSSNNFCGEQRQKPINEHTTTTACILHLRLQVCAFHLINHVFSRQIA